MNKVILFLLFSFFVLNQIVRIPMTSAVVINPLDVVVVIAVFVTFIKKSKNREVLSNIEKYLLFPLGLFVGVGLLGLFINPWLPQFALLPSILYLLRWVVYMLFFYYIYSLSIRDTKITRIFMVLSGGVITFLGFLQYFYYPDLKNLYYLGWDDHLYRLFSTFLDPNFAGAFFVLFSFYLLLFIKLNERKFSFLNILTFFLYIMSIVAIYLTYSRTAFVMLFVGTLIFLSLHRQFKVLFFSIFVLVALFFIFAGELEGLNPLRIASVNARIESSLNAFSIFLYHPVVGVGFNAYRFAQIHFGFRGGESAFMSHADASTDNSYLFILATTGIAGLACFIFLWRRIVSLFKNTGIKERSVVYASLGAFFVGSLFTNLLFYSPLLLWIMLLCGTTLNKKS